MDELLESFLYGFMDAGQNRRIRSLNKSLKRRRAKANSQYHEAREERDQLFHEVDELTEALVQVEMVNEMLIEILQRKMGVSEAEMNAVMDEIVARHEAEEQRHHEDIKVTVAEVGLDSPVILEEDESAPTEPKLQSRQHMFCPHCEMALDECSDECPWCYGAIRWI